jgi:hypothetical protein
MEIRSAMIPMTTNNSTSVKADLRFTTSAATGPSTEFRTSDTANTESADTVYTDIVSADTVSVETPTHFLTLTIDITTSRQSLGTCNDGISLHWMELDKIFQIFWPDLEAERQPPDWDIKSVRVARYCKIIWDSMSNCAAEADLIGVVGRAR